MPDINFFPVVVDCRNQSILISSDVENRETVDLIGGGKRDPKVGKRSVVGLADDGVPVIQWSLRIRMFLGEFDQPLSRNDMHNAILSQFEINVKNGNGTGG